MTKTARVELRLNQEEYNELKSLASAAGVSISEFIRQKVLSPQGIKIIPQAQEIYHTLGDVYGALIELKRSDEKRAARIESAIKHYLEEAIKALEV